MASSLLMAVIVAVGHHLFYSSLAGTTVLGNENQRLLGFQVSSQQINFALGTALAFFNKTCLVLAVSTAYVQVFWQVVKHTREKQHTLENLDILASGLDDFFALLNMFWWKHPILMLLVIATWFVGSMMMNDWETYRLT
jgi:hypothetical protein